MNHAELRDAENVCFLDAPISQGGLFNDTFEDFTQQFLAVKKQTKANNHSLPQCMSSSN